MRLSPLVLGWICLASAEHHMKQKAAKRQNGGGTVPLIVTNQCNETIYPAILTQSGTGPSSTGFELSPGSNKTQSVSSDWQGRVWGRTNCSFDAQGQSGGGRACQTGDCGGVVQCQATGETPTTLAEFTLSGAEGSSYYDISMVDGYNLPMAIVLVANGQSSLSSIPANETNPSCVASVGDLASQNYNPYRSGSQTFLGTNSASQLPFDTSVTSSQVAQWCPWDLQVNPPSSPGDGVYPYPDGNIQRPTFNPCFSACAKYSKPEYCCTGQYGPGQCSPNYYSSAAKSVCPDAYSYAYDDQDSTFIVPAGAGFQVVMCPGGRSTTIISSKSGNGQVQHSSSPKSMGSRNPFIKGWSMIDDVMLKAVVLGAVVMTLMA